MKENLFMKREVRPELIEELVNCILLLDPDFNIIVIGQRIYKKLCNHGISLKENFLDILPGEEDIGVMKTKFNNVLTNWYTERFLINSINLSGFLIPMVFGERKALMIVDEKCFLKARKLEHDLKERMKELRCLYTIGASIGTDLSLEDIMFNATRALIMGFQYPEVATAYIKLGDKSYSVKPLDEKELKTSLVADIEVNGMKRGTVQVSYTENREFIKEETDLLNEISRMLSKAIEKRDLEAVLKQYVNNLEALVQKKTADLEKSNKRFSDLLEYAPDGIVISGFDGDIVNANRAFYRMLKYPEDGSVKLTNYLKDNLYYELEKDRPPLLEKLKEEGRVEGYEFNLRDINGEPCPVIASFNLIDIDGKLYDEAIYKDVRLRKELEQKLIEQNENLEKIVEERTEALEAKTKKLSASMNKLNTLFNAITDTVLMIDKDFNIQMSNRKDFKAGKCYEVVFGTKEPCKDCPACPAVRCFKEKKPVTLEKKVGNDYYLMQAYPITSPEGELEGVLEFSRVITKEKDVEMQLLQADKLASLGQLVSGIAHEINNPNTFIRGNIMIVEEALKDMLPVIDKYYDKHPDLKIARLKYNIFRDHILVLVDDILKGANRIKSIVEDLKKFARRDEGLLTDDIDMNAVVQSCLRLVRNQIKRNANIKMDLDLDIPTVKGNMQKLEQVIVNMLINASQAIEKTRGTIEISTKYDEKEEEISLKIKDDGKGMSEQVIKQIFNPFFTTKRTRGGTGLGLSLAYGIIKEHRGRIDVDSEPGVGTVFNIRLPVNDKHEE